MSDINNRFLVVVDELVMLTDIQLDCLDCEDLGYSHVLAVSHQRDRAHRIYASRHSSKGFQQIYNLQPVIIGTMNSTMC